MSEWSNSDDEEENRFKLQPTDFKVINVQFESKPEQEIEQEEVVNTEYVNEEPLSTRENHFYAKLGFRVGEYFAGEKKIYQKRK